MTNAAIRTLSTLLNDQSVAALGTLHEGEPFVSMVPFAALSDGSGLIIHVSALSSHTGDMLASAAVSVLVVAHEDPDLAPQARARATIRARAERLVTSSPGHEAARAAYLARFPHAASLFALPDFSLFVLRPVAIRLIGGFAQAETLPPEALAAAVAAER